MGWPAADDGTIPPQARDSAAGLSPVQINRSAVAAEPTANITLNANLPATETQSTAAGTALPVNIEYFDNLGASQALAMSFSPVIPAPGDPQSNTWVLSITDQASGLLAGSFEITFRDTVPSAGNVQAVVQTVPGTAPLTTAYDAATGRIALDLGNQQIGIQIGSTNLTGPHNLSQLSSIFSPVGVTKNGTAAGNFTGVTSTRTASCRPTTRAASAG
jgi:flagellar hook protein FlgE